MEKFTQILDKLDPDKNLLTEDTRKELVSMLESKIKMIKEEALSKAVELANEKISKLDEEHTQKLEELQKAFETKLSSSDEDYGQKFQEIIEKLDTEHADEFKSFVERMDEDYATKFEQAVKILDEDHTKKFEEVTAILTKKNLTEKMATIVDGYLDTYLKDVMPESVTVDTAKLKRLDKFYESIKEMVLVDSDYIQTEVKEAILDAKSKIDEANSIVEKKDKEIDTLMFEKIELKKQIEKIEANKLLSEKTKDMTPDLKAYVETSFANATTKEITEKLDEAVKAFKKKEDDKRKEIISSSESKSKVKNPVILEDTTQKDLKNAPDDEFAAYVKILNKNTRK